MKKFSITESKGKATLPPTGKSSETPKGLGRDGNKPLMRNREAIDTPSPIGQLAATLSPGEILENRIRMNHNYIVQAHVLCYDIENKNIGEIAKQERIKADISTAMMAAFMDIKISELRALESGFYIWTKQKAKAWKKAFEELTGKR